MANKRLRKHTFQNAAQALGDGNILYVEEDMKNVTFDIDGSGTNEVTFEGLVVNYKEKAGVNLGDFTLATKTTAKGVTYQVGLEGLVALKVRVSSYTNGVVTAEGWVTD